MCQLHFYPLNLHFIGSLPFLGLVGLSKSTFRLLAPEM